MTRFISRLWPAPKVIGRLFGDDDAENGIARKLCRASARHHRQLLTRRDPADLDLVAAANTFPRHAIRVRNVERKDQISAVMQLSSNPEFETLALLVG